MYIISATIENYRAISSVDVSFGEYTAFIGYNGSGKSSILRALDWFFTGSSLTEEDFHIDKKTKRRRERICVEVTLGGLDGSDGNDFGKYSRGETMTLRRVASVDGGQKLYGKARYHRDLHDALGHSGIQKIRTEFDRIIGDKKVPLGEDWRKISTKKALLEHLEVWESDPENWKYLDEVDDEEASHLKGFAGTSLVQNQSGYIFIPAAPDLSGEFSTETKESALSILLGRLMKDSVDGAIEQWKNTNSTALDSLEEILRVSTNTDLKEFSSDINSRLVNYVADASLGLELKLPDWTPKIQPVTQATITQEDMEVPVENTGHGIQRATLLAMLQALAERRTMLYPDGSTHCAGDRLIVVIEEPEVYQHPVQARKLATELREAAEANSLQVICATHSPYFVFANDLSSTHRVVPSEGGTVLKGGSFVGQFESDARSGKGDKWFRTSITEALFSKSCLIVEGDTDQFIFENIKLDTLGDGSRRRSLPDLGISVVNAQGAGSLWPIANLIESFGVPCYVVRDGDSSVERSQRRATDEKTSSDIRESWKAAVESFVEKEGASNEFSELGNFKWGSGAFYGRKVAILDDDLEAELESWRSFMENLPEESPADLRNAKYSGIYSRTLKGASLDDCPEGIKSIFAGVVRLS